MSVMWFSSRLTSTGFSLLLSRISTSWTSMELVHPLSFSDIGRKYIPRSALFCERSLVWGHSVYCSVRVLRIYYWLIHLFLYPRMILSHSLASVKVFALWWNALAITFPSFMFVVELLCLSNWNLSWTKNAN